MNILFTSIGRRVELVQAFHQAAETLNVDLHIYGADVSVTAPALFFCDHRVSVPPICAPDYIPELVATCDREKIDALIPTIDLDLALIAANSHAFAEVGTRAIISDQETVRICRDKRRTADFFRECGLKTPETVDAVERYIRGFPCFMKPMHGSSSVNAFKVENQKELEAYAHKVSDYIIQPFIDGKEYTVDIFCDFSGNPIYITPRERIAVRGGEVLKSKIVRDEQIINGCRKLIEKLKPIGAITVQLIRKVDDGEDYYIEINPRFGGGAPFTMKAGANSALMMLQLLAGEAAQYQPNVAQDGAVYSRYDQSVCVENGVTAPVGAVIFDLDDTLYSEKEYVNSGCKEVSKLFPEIPDIYKKLWNSFERGKSVFDAVLIDAGIYSDELKNLCLEIYRKHVPSIEPYDGMRDLIAELKRRKVKIGIITDGRPEGQRNKIQALGLHKLVDEIMITDELGGEKFRKPNDIAFRVMQRRLGVPFERMMYVGDNLGKDFAAPAALSMQCLYFNNPDGLYSNIAQREENIDRSLFRGIATCKEELIQLIRQVAEGKSDNFPGEKERIVPSENSA